VYQLAGYLGDKGGDRGELGAADPWSLVSFAEGVAE
jgi:hypothetical protein